MDGFGPIIVIEGFLGFGVVFLIYWMHRREMKALAKQKSEGLAPANPLVATRDAAREGVERERAAILAKLELEANPPATEIPAPDSSDEHAPSAEHVSKRPPGVVAGV